MIYFTYYFGDASGKVIKEKEKRLTSFIPNNNWTTASQKTVFQLRASHLFFPAILLLKKHQKKFQWSLYKCFLFFFHLAIDLIKKLLTTDPQKRITVDGALQHPWISVSICPWTRTVYIPTRLLVLGVFFHSNVCAFMTKSEVKMTGSWACSFFAFLWIETSRDP